MNIYDISEKAGVSIATVSRVINGNPNVSEKTRAKVLQAIEENGYTPNVFARGLGLNTMKTIGIMCADSSDPYLAHAIYYLEQELRKNNYDALLMCTGHVAAEKAKCAELLMSKRVDAVILVGSNYVDDDDSNNRYIYKAASSVPVMILNGILNGTNIYCTACDDHSAIAEVTNRFFAAGRKKLVYLNNSNSYSAQRKRKGFISAMKAHGVTPDESNFIHISSDVNDVNEIRDLVAQCIPADCDGVIAAEDILAIGVLKYAKQKKISVPRDLFISGYNNSNISLCCDPELTTVDNKLKKICVHSVNNLMSVFAGDESIPNQTLFSADIVERETTKF